MVLNMTLTWPIDDNHCVLHDEVAEVLFIHIRVYRRESDARIELDIRNLDQR